MQKVYILFLLFFNGVCLASPDSTLYVSIKNNNLCLYTRGSSAKAYGGRVYVYLGEVSGKSAYKSSYSKLYNNIETPNKEQNCIIVNASNFKNNIPYYLNMEADKIYSQRVCVTQKSKKTVLMKVDDPYGCSQEEYDYSGRSLWEKFLNWLGFN